MPGYFLFGGSDFIMIFQSNVTFTLDASKTGNNSFKHLLMGERMGHLTIDKRITDGNPVWHNGACGR
jgi:phosphatidylserine decarboxylase